MEIVDCCNMGLKLRAELEVCLTIVAMLVECRSRNEGSARCDTHMIRCGACPVAESKSKWALMSTCSKTDMLAPFLLNQN